MSMHYGDQSDQGSSFGQSPRDTPRPPVERVGIFWDFENCPPPSNTPGYIVADSVRRMAHRFGSVTLFKAYLELSENTSPKTLTLRSELQSSGVSLTDCPHNGRKDVADKMLMIDMMAWCLDNATPATVVLISGDRDFVYAISVIRQRRYNVVLVVPPQGAHITLKSQANLVLEWRYDVLDMREGSGSGDSPPGRYADIPTTPATSKFGGRRKSVSAAPATYPAGFNTLASSLYPLADILTPRTPTSPSPGVRSPGPQSPRDRLLDPIPLILPPTRRAPSSDFAPESISAIAPYSRNSSYRSSDAPQFDILIEVLEKLRLQGNFKPLRSTIGSELMLRDPLLYENSGVASFGQYVSLASEKGIVQLGSNGVHGSEWIRLLRGWDERTYYED
ncbi:hypothetical protein BOTBODRAFT_166064 [Botryobasidium botryosum FD-172 SS1]|uniref:NYN domain-containing protein n=1 Tax=Botryobasidium botryosum (strain FD-172 SS1) TaxID=930990 RepID=A0A067M952_BOTB1|nr:hypothetical protein BOTBODRAFT_166064 [Botryobasidium botryosum FD-172 SS1]